MKTRLLILLLAFLLSIAVEARGIWGRKKPRDEDSSAEEAAANNVADLLGGLDSTISSSTRRRGVNSDSIGNKNVKAAAAGVAGGGGMEDMFEKYIEMMEQMVDSPDFDSMVTPETLKQVFANMPGGLGGELGKLLDAPQFQDPAALKATIKEGVRTMRQYSAQMLEMFSDPSKLASVMDQLPAESRAAMQAMMSGDTSALKDMVASLPGLDGAQKKALSGLVGGDAASLSEAVTSVFEDESQIEAARLEFLKEPSLAEMMGIPREVLADKKKWAELMSEGLAQLQNLGGGESSSGGDELVAVEEEEEVPRVAGRRARA